MKKHILSFHSFMILIGLSPLLLGQIGNFDSINSYTGAFDFRLSEINNAIETGSQLSAGDQLFTVTYRYASVEIDPVFERFGRDVKSNSLVLGYNNHLNAFWSLGAIFTLQDGDVDAVEINSPGLVSATGNLSSDGLLAGLLLAYKTESWSLDFAAGLGNADHDMVRIGDLGPVFGPAYGKFDSDSKFLSARLSYSIAMNDGWTATPYLGLGHVEIKTGRIVETSAPDRRIVDKIDVDQPYSLLGLSLGKSESMFSPEFSLAWWHDLGDDSTDFAVQAADGTNLGTLVVPDGHSDLLISRIKVTSNLNEHWKASANLDFSLGDDTQVVGLSIGVGRNF